MRISDWSSDVCSSDLPRRRTRWRTPRPALEQIQADSGSISIMIGLVIVTHGRLAEEFVTAMEHVVGKQERIGTICIGPDDDMEARRADIAAAIADADTGGGVIVLTALCGGTPSNLATSPTEARRIEVNQ